MEVEDKSSDQKADEQTTEVTVLVPERLAKKATRPLTVIETLKYSADYELEEMMRARLPFVPCKGRALEVPYLNIRRNMLRLCQLCDNCVPLDKATRVVEQTGYMRGAVAAFNNTRLQDLTCRVHRTVKVLHEAVNVKELPGPFFAMFVELMTAIAHETETLAVKEKNPVAQNSVHAIFKFLYSVSLSEFSEPDDEV